MAYLVDWNFQILPSLVGNDPHMEKSISAMQSFAQSGIHRFLLLASFDPSSGTPISLHLLRLKKYSTALRKSLPKTLSLQTASRTTLREGLSGMSDLELLCHKKTGYLPLDLPIAAYEDWIDVELNRLLYKKHQKLLFLSFELALILYPDEVIQKLMRIESAAFQFGYKSLDQPAVQGAIKSLLRRKKPVLLGTGRDHFEEAFASEIPEKLKTAKACFLPAEWVALLRSNRRFWT